MTLAARDRLGSYEILTQLGAGGMGEVYRARDTKLGRDVALKILPDSFTHDPERVARFRREAQVLAALNHPHIGAIYGLDEANGTQFLVLELVDGESLEKRIARGPIPLDEALAIAKQIAEALEAAHEKGIIHRDLKPANIALTTDGQVKVLDFGLAKATELSTGTSLNVTNSPTITSPATMTNVGVILGTAAYMSPEQAKGSAADKRSDVWAFGCVLYEMLSRHRAFEGDDVSDMLASVLRAEPNWEAIPAPAVPLTGILRRCLEKDVKRRLRDIGDIRLLLEDLGAARVSSTTASGAPLPSKRSWWVPAIAAVALISSAVAGAFLGQVRNRRPPLHVNRFELAPSRTYSLTTSFRGVNVAVSPDGSRIVYSSVRSTTENRLLIRQLDRLETRPLVEEGVDPFFSPDGESLGFVTLEAIKKVAIGGGPSVTICRLPGVLVNGASWESNAAIVFAQTGTGGGLFRVVAGVGQPEKLAAPDTSKGEINYIRPTVLPGARAVLYTVVLRGGQTRIVTRTLQGSDVATVIEGGFDARYVPSGHLVYGQGDRLMAVRFDVSSMKAIGSPVPIVDDVFNKTAFGVANVATAGDGTMLYVSGRNHGVSGRPVWVDRHGTHVAPLEQQPIDTPRYPRLSPDGRRLALTVGPSAEGNIWVYDLAGTAQPLKLTFRDHNIFPIWSRDGKHIVYLSRAGDNQILSIASDGSTMEPERLTRSENPQIPLDMTSDGAAVLFTQNSALSRGDLWLLSMGDHKVRPWLQTPFANSNARLSPNGRWVAYDSDQTGSLEIWVRPFPGLGAPVRISPDGGLDPVWSRDGKELFYLNGPRMESVHVVSESPDFRAEPPRELFEGGFEPSPVRGFDVAPDGRFVMIQQNDALTQTSLVLVQNWFEELKARVPTK